METTVRAQHTPGPWYVGDVMEILAGDPAQPDLVAEMPDDDPQSLADARLIAAAPALLAALGGLTQIGTTPDGGIIVGPQGWQIARAAIRQARGDD
ncbi:MAG: hypothetical protein NUW01_00045 [Gemmatimonadaceae bacterium]|nr:hypothetical protein [Gemmatimonadaceae bacterium]